MGRRGPLRAEKIDPAHLLLMTCKALGLLPPGGSLSTRSGGVAQTNARQKTVGSDYLAFILRPILAYQQQGCRFGFWDIDCEGGVPVYCTSVWGERFALGGFGDTGRIAQRPKSHCTINTCSVKRCRDQGCIFSLGPNL